MTVFAARTTTRKSGMGNPPFAANAFWRLLVLVAMFGLFILLLIGRLATLALFESTRAFGATTSAYVPVRGDIVDRNGVPLARSIYGYAIWVKPQDILGNKRELAAQLATIFPDTPASEFHAKLIADKPGYLRKRALPEQVRQVHDLGEIAIEFPREATRLYPQHDMAAHVLGFVNRDGKGAMGMERVMNDHLRDPAKRGKPLNLALDVRVQAALESELAQKAPQVSFWMFKPARWLRWRHCHRSTPIVRSLPTFPISARRLSTGVIRLRVRPTMSPTVFTNLVRPSSR
jgi:cell division protein FtsI (penicillin-binding protein 3)